MKRMPSFWGDVPTTPPVQESGEYGTREISMRGLVRGLFWWNQWLLVPPLVRLFGSRYGQFLPISGNTTGGKWYVCVFGLPVHTFRVPYRFVS